MKGFPVKIVQRMAGGRSFHRKGPTTAKLDAEPRQWWIQGINPAMSPISFCHGL